MAKKQNRTRVLMGLGGAGLALWLLVAARRGGNRGIGSGSQPTNAEVEVWVRSGDRLELDGAASNLATTVIFARAVGRANVHATGDARRSFVDEVINALQAAGVTVWEGRGLRNALPRARSGSRNTARRRSARRGPENQQVLPLAAQQDGGEPPANETNPSGAADTGADPAVLVREGVVGRVGWRQYMVISDERVVIVHMKPAPLGGWRFDRVEVQGKDEWPRMKRDAIVAWKFQSDDGRTRVAENLGDFRERLLEVARAGQVIRNAAPRARSSESLQNTAARLDLTPTHNDLAIADLVYRALAAVQDADRFGDRKVFIASLWTRMRSIEAQTGGTLTADATLEHFKQWLLRARLLTRDGTEDGVRLIVLSRADLVAAMDPARVAASETVTDGAVYHFVLDPAVAREAYAPRIRPQATMRSNASRVGKVGMSSTERGRSR